MWDARRTLIRDVRTAWTWLAIALVSCSVSCSVGCSVGCSGSPRAESPPARPAFYYWRTTFRLSAPEQQALAELHVPRLYVRMFDVEWRDGAPSMIGKIVPGDGQRIPDSVEVVPVIYLRDEVFRQLGEQRTAELARSTWGEVQQRAKLLGFTPHELQLDCDWTDTTRGAFFGYLRQLRAIAQPIALSATIRLHQVKYRERTGVPPVDRGMLMFYNMGKFSPDPDARAIFDAASAEPYLARIADYPLALDVALPIWSWTIQLRDGRVEGLLQATDPDELPAVEFLARSGPDRFVATRSAFLHGTLLREGDVLKIERMAPSDTRAAADMLAPHLAPVATPRTISLFDLSERNLGRHGTAQLEQIFQAVR
jgi:hypothetical protein